MLAAESKEELAGGGQHRRQDRQFGAVCAEQKAERQPRDERAFHVHHNLAGILSAHLPRARLDYWSIQGRHEVDFVISLGREAVAIEVKAGARVGERDLAGLEAFKAQTPGVRAGIVAYNGTEVLRLGDDLYAIPLSLLLS